MNTRYLQTVSQLQLILLSILLQAKNCKNNNLLIKLSEHKHFDKKIIKYTILSGGMFQSSRWFS
jgi:hypothetical protein